MSYNDISQISSDTFTEVDVWYLYMSHNAISSVPSYAFKGLDRMRYLYLEHNQIDHVASNAFAGTSKLKYLNLSHNNMTNVSSNALTGLKRLEELFLDHNQISVVPSNALPGTRGLTILNMDYNQISQISPNAFVALGRLYRLHLEHNKIRQVSSDAFAGLGRLVSLFMSNNQIYEIPPNVFTVLVRLQILVLDHNLIGRIPSNVFAAQSSIFTLRLSNCQIISISEDLFAGMLSLYYLDVSSNQISRTSTNAFRELLSLKYLLLSYNNISYLQDDLFTDNANLVYLSLDHNLLTHFPVNILHGLPNLQMLKFENNQIKYLADGIFNESINLQFVNVSGNNIDRVAPHLFQQCSNLVMVDLSNNTLDWVTKKSFRVLNATIYVENYDTCCFIETNSCYYKNQQSPYLTCNRLLGNSLLRLIMWFLGIGAILGNIVAICYRYRQMKIKMTTQLLIITNLSVSDLLMGVYLLILTSVDLFFTEYFPSHSDEWRHGILCKVAGAFAVLSSEASVFLITFISIDRYFGIKYPLSAKRFGSKSTKIILTILWAVAIGITIGTLTLSQLGSESTYDVPEVCISLPISRKPIYSIQTLNKSIANINFPISFNRGTYVPDFTIEYTSVEIIDSETSMFFSIVVFSGLNLLCFLIVAFCYLLIFIEVYQSANRSGRSRTANEEIRMAKKIAAIVLTDFCCWIPIIILSILVQSKVATIDPVAYVWIATFILPINSTVNPFLYTLASALFDWLEKRNQPVSRTDFPMVRR